MQEVRLFEYANHWLVRRTDTPMLYIYWCQPGTRRVLRRSTGTTELEHAKKKLIAFVNGEPMAGQVALQARADPGVMDLMDSYTASFGEDRKSYDQVCSAKERWREFLKLYDIATVSQLSLDVQERFVTWRRQQLVSKLGACSNWTIHHDLSVLKASLRHGWKRGRLAYPPYVVCLPKPGPRDRFLTADEARRLLACCEEPHLYRFVLLALHTLQRPISIFELRCDQVDLVHGRINFLPAGQLQSAKRRPVVPITATLRPELEKAIAESYSGYVVEYNLKPISSVRKSFQEACRRAGIQKASPYILRYTGATLLCAAGVPMREVAGMLGHSHERTTEIYARFRPDFLKNAAATLDNLFTDAAEPVCAPVARQNAGSAVTALPLND